MQGRAASQRMHERRWGLPSKSFVVAVVMAIAGWIGVRLRGSRRPLPSVKVYLTCGSDARMYDQPKTLIEVCNGSRVVACKLACGIGPGLDWSVCVPTPAIIYTHEHGSSKIKFYAICMAGDFE